MQVAEHQLGTEKHGRRASHSDCALRFCPQASRRTLEYREKNRLRKPSDVIHPRLFPSVSPILSFARNTIEDMVENTSVRGLVEGARALVGYNLLSAAHGGASRLDVKGRPSLFESENEEVLLLFGDLDGNGKVAQSSENLKKSWDEALADVEEGEEDGCWVSECR
jgi:hypothetical protein